MDKDIIKRVYALKMTDSLMIYDVETGLCWPTGKRHLAMTREKADKLLAIAGYERVFLIPCNGRDDD